MVCRMIRDVFELSQTAQHSLQLKKSSGKIIRKSNQEKSAGKFKNWAELPHYFGKTKNFKNWAGLLHYFAKGKNLKIGQSFRGTFVSGKNSKVDRASAVFAETKKNCMEYQF